VTNSVLRLIDANANRAREALRVLEDYARFVLNNYDFCTHLKLLRHDLTESLKPVLHTAILHRDTANDIGADNKTPAELTRADSADVVVAAGKRLGESLRCLEEFAKIDFPQSARAIERLRYRFYDLERDLNLTLRPAKYFANVRLCVLITSSLCKAPWLKVAEQAIEGGADCLQLREKDLDSGELLCRAKDFVALCKSRKVVSIINDRPDIVLLSGADGVHVGQTDLPAREARKIIGPDKILGVSTHNLSQAQQALLDSADYIGVGPVFPSATKPRDFLPGLDFAREVAQSIPIPALAIAGITLNNVDEVLATGITGIAVTAAVLGADDPLLATSRIKERIHRRDAEIAERK